MKLRYAFDLSRNLVNMKYYFFGRTIKNIVEWLNV